ncbi:MAG: M48 family metalloprotease [Betaproteobacteria bacterium]|nr:M48 family metalloprotease [Betaproteobacteria bacterium]MDH5351471.1 M48 family metalloprotease [Betaproteobacteria bacterium]
MRIRYLARGAIAALLLAGCAAPTTRPVNVGSEAADAEALKQTELALEDLIDKHKRAQRVYRQLATRAYGMCGDQVGPDVGMYALVRPEKGPFGPVLERKYGVGERPTILFVLEGGPAQAAGLRPGDVISKVNGTPASEDNPIEKLLEGLPPEAPILYEIARSGEAQTVTVQPERACSYRVLVGPSQAVNAFADGKRILVTRGMVNFATSDDELALVLSHEMAHNVMRHLEAKKQNAGVGALADIALLLLSRGQVSSRAFTMAAAQAYSQEFEAEADYVGLYIMANAGMPIDDAPLFWRRMAAAHPGSIRANHAATHPSTSQRMVALESTVKEIGAKVAAGEPLLPNMKEGETAPSIAATTAPPAVAAPAPRAAAAPAPVVASAPAAAPAPSASAAAPASTLSAAPAQVALAAPSAPTRDGLPGAGASWTYEVADRMYRSGSFRLTVDIMSAAHEFIEERLTVRGGAAGAGVPSRVIQASAARFFEITAVAGKEFVEFAPYFLAAHGDKASTLAFDAAGYPPGPGNPGWVVHQTQPAVWERITVPAGTFRALRLEFGGKRERTPFSPIVTYRFRVRVWYAPEVNRYVRLEQVEWLATRQSSDTVVELVRFKPPS